MHSTLMYVMTLLRRRHTISLNTLFERPALPPRRPRSQTLLSNNIVSKQPVYINDSVLCELNFNDTFMVDPFAEFTSGSKTNSSLLAYTYQSVEHLFNARISLNNVVPEKTATISRRNARPEVILFNSLIKHLWMSLLLGGENQSP